MVKTLTAGPHRQPFRFFSFPGAREPAQPAVGLAAERPIRPRALRVSAQPGKESARNLFFLENSLHMGKKLKWPYISNRNSDLSDSKAQFFVLKVSIQWS